MRSGTGFLAFVFLFLTFLCGCASLKEGAKGFAGISTRVLEESRKDAAVKVFKGDYSSVADKTRDALREIGAYVYADDAAQGLIAAYVSETDTTPVGLFLRAVDAGSTRVEVSCPSIYARELFAGQVFALLGGKPLKKKTTQ